MPLRNRVTPLSEFVAHPARGLVYGNRGCLHDADGRIVRRYAVRRWIACRLEFKGWQRGPMMQPGKFTELFFLDEATALAAGHRPCAMCRRSDYERFGAVWRDLHGGSPSADEIDVVLHAERIDPVTRGQRRYDAEVTALPDAVFILRDGEPWLVFGNALLRWTPGGYDLRVPRPASGRATVITPPSLVHLLGAGWDPVVPLIHPSAR